ncbi:XDD3 family exosortase-dependent surface protein [Limnothrix sp. PR1529]|uniref:XDD3 family exosortase-dependent surface protein n=1 Tax=Limnothrix sp. PR1529 TaxID=1704291 RepID=UPI00081E54C1|nr:XDD3 family exosortase-dependent surface protein [Limnothrix sp. PR1529]OCQ92349.1 hypothetical protein BCR12_06570 [Limnothrix sp. P13C2]
MKPQQLLASIATATLCTLGVGLQAANAGTVYNDWNYGIDSFKDGVSGSLGGLFEMYGFGIKQDGETIYVGIDARLPITGQLDNGALNKSITWGDMFFNFSGNPLLNAQGNLFGVRFASTNDSAVKPLGLYSQVSGKNVASQNRGFASYADQSKYVTGAKGIAGMGELTDAEAKVYFKDASLNVISKGQQVVESVFESLDSTTLSALGFNLNGALNGAKPPESNANGAKRQTFGFKFTRGEGMVGDFVAHVFAECLNDGMAVRGNLAPKPEPTPEPISLLGLAAVGAAVATRRYHAAKVG